MSHFVPNPIRPQPNLVMIVGGGDSYGISDLLLILRNYSNLEHDMTECKGSLGQLRLAGCPKAEI